jgi:hypothetical protein
MSYAARRGLCARLYMVYARLYIVCSRVYIVRSCVYIGRACVYIGRTSLCAYRAGVRMFHAWATPSALPGSEGRTGERRSKTASL